MSLLLLTVILRGVSNKQLIVFFFHLNRFFHYLYLISATGFDEDIATITAGKEFTLVKTTGGKVRSI